MQALILDGSQDGDSVSKAVRELVEAELKMKGWQVDSFLLRTMDISACLGCFKCWTHTPGICITNDHGRKIPENFVKSDLAIFLSPITFGGYSSVFKKGLDRIIPVMSPFFQKIEGEIHHKQRYDRYPRLLAIGVLPQPEESSENIFKTLVTRNAINLLSPAHVTGIIFRNQSTEEVRGQIKTFIDKAGAGL
jgi:multimeric flavodoxin WrbA